MTGDHEVLFSEEVVADAVRDLAAAIDRDFGDSRVVVVLTVLKGAAIFSSDLVRAMNTETELAYMTVSSYSDGFTYGYGLDWDERYRDLPFIALANP